MINRVLQFSPTTTAVGGIVELIINGQNLKVVDRPVSVEIGDTVCDVTSASNNQLVVCLSICLFVFTSRNL